MSSDELTELCDVEAERKVLGMLMAAPQELPESGVGEELFVIFAHKTIFSAIAAYPSGEGEIEPQGIASVLKQAGNLDVVGGLAGIWEMRSDVVVFLPKAFKQAVEILREYKALRTLRKIGHQCSQMVLQRVPSPDIAHLMQKKLGELSAAQAEAPWRSIGDFAREAIEDIDAAKKGEVVRMKTGLAVMDAKFYQILDKGNLVIVAARPSMGKTSLVLGMALELAAQGQTVGVVSLEMPGRRLAKRAMLLHAEHLSVAALDHGALTSAGWTELVESCGKFAEASVYLTDQPRMSVGLLARKARELQRTKGLDVLMVDYLQLMELNPKANTKNEAVEEASRDLKLLAMELDIPVVVLSQLSRECEKRSDRRPIMSDLRDSGAIEQDADVVWMIYRDEVYDKDTPDVGIAEMLMRKNRNGPVGEEKVRFITHRTKFEDL